ncbi:MAG: ubiquinone-binding protein [Citromicrobium sp.]|nr:MAG: ubiquinone-binding protein [Citromicrobium sp.]
MPGIRQTRRLPYSPEQMFDLVADVARYPEFLPWVIATRVRSDSETEMVADMLVGFKAIREKFTSRVEKRRPTQVEVFYVDGPLKDLDNNWQFRETEDGGCEIDFCVDFTFRNAIFEAMAGQYFDRAFRKMMEAFEKRADDLYGRSNAAANA